VHAIDAVSIVKTYRGGIEALRGVSFQVNPGEVFGLLGPNGAGKTTVVRILSTLSPATAGTARVAGLDVRQQAAEVRRKIGYVAQNAALDFLATGRENLLFHGHLFGLTGSRLRQRVEEQIDLFQLGEAADRLTSTYSGGMRRRLDLAMGLIHVPAVLFLDEPTTGLDPQNRQLVWDKIRSLASRDGIAVLLTTHYMDEADALAARLAIIDCGRIVAAGAPEALKSALKGDVVTVEVASVEAVAVARDVIQRVDGVTQVIADAATLFAQVPDGSIAVPLIVGALRERQIVLGRVSLNRPSLDEVYLSATGRKYQPGNARPRQAFFG
jgi:ABC-2 type transport system ATP-binding protein